MNSWGQLFDIVEQLSSTARNRQATPALPVNLRMQRIYPVYLKNRLAKR